jgi:hypothetical protein
LRNLPRKKTRNQNNKDQIKKKITYEKLELNNKIKNKYCFTKGLRTKLKIKRIRNEIEILTTKMINL